MPKYAYDQRRGSRHQRGYTNRWTRTAKSYLASHPWCVICERVGKKTPATCVDHIKAHKGDMRVFWDSSNWQSLCTTCHSSKTRGEMTGKPMHGCGADGMPIDPHHPWYEGHGGGGKGQS